MKRCSLIVSIFFLVFLAAGCAYMGAGTESPNPELAAQYNTSAQELEKQGDLPAALEQYKLALTADPENATAKENIERLSQKLANLADQRYKLGMKYYRQGKYGLARKEFLTALKFQPDHPEASKMLVSKEPQKAPSYIFHMVKPGESLSMIAKQYYGDYKKFDVIARFNGIKDATMVKPGQRIMIPEIDGNRLEAETSSGPDSKASYIEHTLRPGESISMLAKMYYGDYKQFHIIAQFNHMEDATRVTVGQIIKVPKVAGLPFYAQAPKAGPSQDEYQKEPSEESASEPVTTETEEAAEKENEPAADEQILAYRDSGIDLFKEGKYEDAVFELNKAIEAAPNDPQTRSYLARAYFESGKLLFGQQDFKAAQEAFESSRQYDPKCDECLAYIEKSKIGPLLTHRSKGIEHFNKNEFKQAIAEFEKFLYKKPDDNEIRIYLSKSYFQQALSAYNKGNFLEAKNNFESALQYDSACEKCATYINQSLDSYKESHYNKGIIYFGKEQLPEAISEWEMTYKIDPNYKDVDQNLKKARSLMEKLEKIKKSSK